MSIEVNNESGEKVDEQALVELSRYVLDRMDIHPMAELSIVLLDTPAMAALHEQWMDLQGPTDVMSFPMDAADGTLDLTEERGGPGSAEDDVEVALLGDVVICPAVAASQAAEVGHSVESELHMLCTHGILHLLGYDHGDADDEREMFELQAKLLAGWVEHTGRPPIKAPRPGTKGEVRDIARDGPRGASGGRHA